MGLNMLKPAVFCRGSTPTTFWKSCAALQNILKNIRLRNIGKVYT